MNLTLKWHRTAGNREVWLSEDGSISVTRLPDWQYVVKYRTPQEKIQTLPLWTWVSNSEGRKLEFDLPDEAVEEALKKRAERFGG
jgi:hypothetical protein